MTQQTLREKIKEIIQESHDCAEWNCYERHNQDINAILQQVIEWVDKEVVGEDENIRFLSYVSTSNARARNTLRASQRQKLQQLKEEV